MWSLRHQRQPLQNDRARDRAAIVSCLRGAPSARLTAAESEVGTVVTRPSRGPATQHRAVGDGTRRFPTRRFLSLIVTQFRLKACCCSTSSIGQECSGSLHRPSTACNSLGSSARQIRFGAMTATCERRTSSRRPNDQRPRHPTFSRFQSVLSFAPAIHLCRMVGCCRSD
jgi:hypothetical protein